MKHRHINKIWLYSYKTTLIVTNVFIFPSQIIFHFIIHLMVSDRKYHSHVTVRPEAALAANFLFLCWQILGWPRSSFGVFHVMKKSGSAVILSGLSLEICFHVFQQPSHWYFVILKISHSGLFSPFRFISFISSQMFQNHLSVSDIVVSQDLQIKHKE